jgi:hypothetical protein
VEENLGGSVGFMCCTETRLNSSMDDVSKKVSKSPVRSRIICCMNGMPTWMHGGRIESIMI